MPNAANFFNQYAETDEGAQHLKEAIAEMENSIESAMKKLRELRETPISFGEESSVQEEVNAIRNTISLLQTNIQLLSKALTQKSSMPRDEHGLLTCNDSII